MTVHLNNAGETQIASADETPLEGLIMEGLRPKQDDDDGDSGPPSSTH